jgi:hypothetical protein
MQLHLDTFDWKENRTMADDIGLEEKLRKFDGALDKLQRTVKTGAGVLHETLDEFLEAAHNYRSDMRYKAMVGSASHDSDSNVA